jgi:hypothetical protein
MRGISTKVKRGPMDVRVIIACHPDGGCRVNVASTKAWGHLWLREFESTDLCLTELRTLGLLTARQVAEIHAGRFDKSSGLLMFHADAEPEALIAANFEQQF